MLVSGIMQKNNTTDNGFVTIMNDFQFMPIMKQTGMGSILFWFALSLCGFTPSRLQHIYGTTDTTSEAYITGANQVGEMFANYLFMHLLLLPLLAKYTSRKFTHLLHWYAVDLVLYPSISYRTNEPSLWLMVGVGLLGQVLFYSLCDVIRFITSDKMGYYMGVLTSLS
jgi:maltose/moltooligosaccharide transporter